LYKLKLSYAKASEEKNRRKTTSTLLSSSSHKSTENHGITHGKIHRTSAEERVPTQNLCGGESPYTEPLRRREPLEPYFIGTLLYRNLTL
jgi:hypothetical protein